MTAAPVLAPAPRERPILFSGPLVRAILEGRKTVTRRLVKPQPAFTPEQERELTAMWPDATFSEVVNLAWQDGWVDVKCPYGEPGDRLWVRETWCYEYDEPGGVPVEPERFLYRADGHGADEAHIRWCPSIHMPRWASRLTLEVTDVRVERLQAITEDDARAEGVGLLLADAYPQAEREALTRALQHSRRDGFAWLWDSINGERASWASNPWVWRIAFRRMP